RPLLQQEEQLLAADAAEAVAGGDRLGALEVDGDVVPIGEMGAHRFGALRVVRGEIGERFVGQDHAPAEGVVRPVALDDGDLMRRIAQFHGNREIEPGRPAAEACDSHGAESSRPVHGTCAIEAAHQPFPRLAVVEYYFKYKFFELEDSAETTIHA